MKLSIPGMGFIILVLIYLFAALFFAWGLAEPEQDRIWTIAQKMRAGDLSGISPEDLSLFQKKIRHDAPLASWLLGGRAWGLVSPNSLGWIDNDRVVLARTNQLPKNCSLNLRLLGPQGSFPVEITVKGLTWQKHELFKTSGQYLLDIPAIENQAEIIFIQQASPQSASVNFYTGIVCSSSAQRPGQ